jgi:hypothetical protein
MGIGLERPRTRCNANPAKGGDAIAMSGTINNDTGRA